MFFSMLLLLYLFSAVSADYLYAQTSGCSPLPRAQQVQLSSERMADGKTAIKAVFRIIAAPEAVYETLRDAARFPEFMPDTREVRIVETGPGYQIAYFWGGAGLFESKLTLKREYDDRRQRISWSLVSGRPRAVTGFWQIEKEPARQGAVVTYVNHIDAGIWIPDAVARAFIRKDIDHMAANLRKRVLSGNVWKSEEYLKRMH
jgi:ribosome-associated toxin RatA of RatAB toxin-antitoxin module